MKFLHAIEEIETKMTINNATTSEIIEINHQAGIRSCVKFPKNTFDVIKTGFSSIQNFHRVRFDITVGPSS